MARGDLLADCEPVLGSIPWANSTRFNLDLGGSSPQEALHQWLFDDIAIDYIDFFLTIPNHYSGRGTKVIIHLRDVGNTNAYRVRAAWRRLEPADNFDSAHTYSYNEVTITGTGTAGQGISGEILFSHGADQDNINAGDQVILRVGRNYAHADDTFVGNMLMRRVVVEEQ